MKAKLIKVENGYELFTQGFLKGSTNHGLIESLNIEEGPIRYKLSPKNCQAIERGYDLDELLKKEIANGKLHPNDGAKKEGIERGIQIALEIFGDKKFSEEDMGKAWSEGYHRKVDEINGNELRYFDKFIQSLQKTEWDVTVEMEYVGECNGNNDEGCFQDSPGHNCGCFERRPKLDTDECLILKTFKSE